MAPLGCRSRRLALGATVVVAAGAALQGCGPPGGGGGGDSCDPCGGSARYSETLSTDGSHQKRTISASGCPNHYSICTGKGSGGVPGCGVIGGEGTQTEARNQNTVLEVPAEPVIATQTVDLECTPGQIAIALNGVSIYSGWVRGPCVILDVDDSEAEWTSFDYCSGHAERTGDYHYHFPPSCLLDQGPAFGDGHSMQVGWAKDGFPIYGPKGEGGTDATGLDACGGKAEELPGVDSFKYRYYMSGATSDLSTLPSDPKPAQGEYPFVMKCNVGCTWAELNSGAAKCTGGSSGVADGYTAEAKDGYTEPYTSSASGADDKLCGRNAGDRTASVQGGVRAAEASRHWAWAIVASVVGVLGAVALAAYWFSAPTAEEETELADQRVDPAAAPEGQEGVAEGGEASGTGAEAGADTAA